MTIIKSQLEKAIEEKAADSKSLMNWGKEVKVINMIMK